jgi:hypothetical protein
MGLAEPAEGGDLVADAQGINRDFAARSQDQRAAEVAGYEVEQNLAVAAVHPCDGHFIGAGGAEIRRSAAAALAAGASAMTSAAREVAATASPVEAGAVGASARNAGASPAIPVAAGTACAAATKAAAARAAVVNEAPVSGAATAARHQQRNERRANDLKYEAAAAASTAAGRSRSPGTSHDDL